MSEINDYKLQTLNAYKNKNKAKEYYEQHQGSLSWASIMMKLELKAVHRGLKFFQVNENDVILDVPCGTGVSFNLLSQFKCKVIGIDISNEMLKFAKKSFHNEIDINLSIGDITDLKIKDNSIKGSVILGFFHRVPDKIKSSALNELFRVNKEFIICSFSIDNIFQKIKRRLLVFISSKHMSAPKPISNAKLKNLFSNNNFTIVRQESIFPFLSSEVIIWAKKK
jgi:ubiquinone/menaquinone biosynthesis C-methylase UbiE